MKTRKDNDVALVTCRAPKCKFDIASAFFSCLFWKATKQQKSSLHNVLFYDTSSHACKDKLSQKREGGQWMHNQLPKYKWAIIANGEKLQGDQLASIQTIIASQSRLINTLAVISVFGSKLHLHCCFPCSFLLDTFFYWVYCAVLNSIKCRLHYSNAKLNI